MGRENKKRNDTSSGGTAVNLCFFFSIIPRHSRKVDGDMDTSKTRVTDGGLQETYDIGENVI